MVASEERSFPEVNEDRKDAGRKKILKVDTRAWILYASPSGLDAADYRIIVVRS